MAFGKLLGMVRYGREEQWGVLEAEQREEGKESGRVGSPELISFPELQAAAWTLNIEQPRIVRGGSALAT